MAADSAVKISGESSDFELGFEVFSSNKSKNITKNHTKYIRMQQNFHSLYKKSFERQCEINLFIKIIVASGQVRLQYCCLLM